MSEHKTKGQTKQTHFRANSYPYNQRPWTYGHTEMLEASILLFLKPWDTALTTIYKIDNLTIPGKNMQQHAVFPNKLLYTYKILSISRKD